MFAKTADDHPVIENDLLGFLFYKIDSCPKSKLLKSASKFYSKEAIEEAYALFASFSLRKRTKNVISLASLYNALILSSKEELPLIVCKDINNVPSFAHTSIKFLSDINPTDSPKKDLKELAKETLHSISTQDDTSDDEEDEPQLHQYRKDLEQMKFQITDIAAVILQIKDKIDHIVNTKAFKHPPRKKIKLQLSNSPVKIVPTNSSKDKSEFPRVYSKQFIDEKHIKQENKEDCENIIVLSQDSHDRSKDDTKSNEKIIYIKDEPEILTASSNIALEEENDTDMTTALDGCVGLDEEDTFIVDMSKPNQCDICGSSFPTQSDLESHMETHPARKQFDCILCEKSFKSRKDLRNHFMLCFKDNEERLLLDGLICTTCGRMYGDATALRQHKTVHSPAKPYACPHCTYRYLTKKSLDSHIKTLHNKLNKYFCPFCDHSYISNNYLLVHIRSHTGEKPFKCNECDYKATTQFLVARHMKRHQIQEEYSCDLCDYVSRGADNLRSHKSKMHRNSLIKCRVCGKEFKNATIYNNHFLTHSGEKIFKCQLCPYAGLTKATLTSHMKIHSGTELMKCSLCAMPFRTSFSLRRHMKTHKEGY